MKNENKIFFFFTNFYSGEWSTCGTSCELSQVVGITIYNGGFRPFNNGKIKNVFQ